uniref:Eukaryotic translation initiation factor 3 subunit B n=1 Tax=Panagrellus redivivus TaxID=6233 RepID=A0A7E4VHJ0_PANRE
MAVEAVEVPDFSDPADFVDEITDEEILEGSSLVPPSGSSYEACCLLICGIPIIDQAKMEKLKTVLNKLFVLTSAPVSTLIPTDETGNTKGYCFVEYATPELASAAANLLDNHRFDKSHTFSAYILSSMGKMEKPSEEWKEPTPHSWIDAGDLWWWLQNPKCIDQFATQTEGRDGITLGVYWNSKGEEPCIVSNEGSRVNWSEFIFKWSPYGTYLATYHRPGVVLWGGEKFEKIQKMQHEGVTYLEFSPRETYLITFAYDGYGNQFDNTVRVFDVFTGELKKTFQPSGTGATSTISEWPFLKWSHDEKYFAFCRVKGDTINVYNTETFVVESQIELPGLVSFEWNPTKNTIGYYCEERNESNAPAEIGVIEYPSKHKVRAQRIFSVSSASLYWQKNGDYLAANTERYSSRKIKDGEIKHTNTSSHLEVFDCTTKDVSVQTFQLPEQFISFGFEPKGNKFAVLVGSGNKTTPLIYLIDSQKPVPVLISKLESGIQLSHVKWAPQGGWLVMYSENSTAGQAMFIDATVAEPTRSRIIEHPSMNYGEWDPTGRFFITASAGHQRFETGYRIYTFQGREVYKKVTEGLTRFKWRPRPPLPVGDTKIREIKKNLKALSRKFEEEDRKDQDKASKELIDKRRSLMAEFGNFRADAVKRWNDESAARAALRPTDAVNAGPDLVDDETTIPLTTTVKQLKDDLGDD